MNKVIFGLSTLGLLCARHWSGHDSANIAYPYNKIDVDLLVSTLYSQNISQSCCGFVLRDVLQNFTDWAVD